MATVFGNITAIEILQHAAAGHPAFPRLEDFRRTRAQAFPQRVQPEEVRDFAGSLPLSRPLHVYVSNARGRRNAEDVACHCWTTAALPRGSLLTVGEGICIASPELAFLQAAASSSGMDLLELGYELCGFYGIDRRHGGMYALPAPITSTAKLASYLSRAGGLHGAGLARQALPRLHDRSRSPRESKLHLSLCLPRSCGGQGIDFLELNHRVPLGAAERRAAGQAAYEIDLYAPRAKLGFEYDGAEYHSGQMRTVRDLRKESILAGKGISIHVVTKTQAENALEVIRLAKVAYRAEGKRFRTPAPDHIARTQALLDRLYRPR